MIGVLHIIKMILLLLLCALTGTWADEIEEPPRWRMPPPEGTDGATTRNVWVSFTTMPVDHFDPLNTDTWQMRFMFNEEFFGGDGSPIFILVGGEWEITPGWLQAGNMYRMAQENHGYQIYTEHRYYGQSLPYREFTTENLRFLNVDQALADLAYFIRDILRTQERFANSKIILYGGSYAANMVLWFKQRYPHLVEGVVASSGPIKAKVDFTEYLEVVHEAFHLEGGDECIATIKQGIDDTVVAIQTEEGRRLLERNFGLCAPLNYDFHYEISYFYGLITWTFSNAVQGGYPGNLLAICNNFKNNAYGSTPMEQLGGYLAASRSPRSCWNVTHANIINAYLAYTDSRAWWYQTCTEYGYYQAAPQSGTVFDSLQLLNVDFYVDICRRVFGPEFDEAFVYDAAERVNTVFGGLRPDVNNTINIHGYIDPWRALGVYEEDLKESSPTYTVARASHCFDMLGELQTDTIRMAQVKQIARRIVARWLSS